MGEEIKRIERREPTGGEEEPKEVKMRREKFLDKLSRRRDAYVKRMYRMLPPEEREKIKTEVSDKFKEEFWYRLEANDREAELWYEELKDEVVELMSRGKWEKWKRLFENEIEAAKKADAQMTKEEIELKNLSGIERWRVWFRRFGLGELQRWKEMLEVIRNPMEEGGITEGPERDILEAVELEFEKKRKPEREEVPVLSEEGRLEVRGLIEAKELFPGRQKIEDYKRVFTEKKLGKEGREEEIEYVEQRQRRYKDAEEEIERER